ncbi:hypothetical protein D9758_013194 [Tetrapyrgos nigripes]|uniref:Uncharacterized protein n=1 Tax=Tetrapyrgos nigripes TaxID=182062 RepID=A0A8H5FRP3_9AGAR|nr:hypothetical protein D9758_013194 [Tetrapyrgos nigripes]
MSLEEGIFRGLYVGTGLSTGALDTAVTYLEGQSLYDALLDMQKAPMTRVPLPDIFITLFTAITVFIVDLFFAARSEGVIGQ